MASSSDGLYLDGDDMDFDWTPVESSRKGGGSKDKMLSNKRAHESNEERREVRSAKKIMTEEFEVILKFKTG